MSTPLLPRLCLGGAWACLLSLPVAALDRPGTEFPIYQFPADAIPRIDGSADDWAMVPESYIIGSEELWESSGKHERAQSPNLDVRVRVGWVEGTSQLYFLYEAEDDYWDFALPGLKNDTFEIVVDGDLSGGPLIDRFRINEDVLSQTEAFFSLHGVHAQNYHIFTPAQDKSWAMLWGTQQWLKELPFANAAYDYDFAPGEGGRLTLEFFITVFDHASPEGPRSSAPSRFAVDQLIGLSWAIIDYDDVESTRNNGFWTLSRTHTMYGRADQLVAFRLMPLEPEHLPALQADWDFTVINKESRLVSFRDQSSGSVSRWLWDFGDGETSPEQHPIHQYREGGHYVVTLTVWGEDATESRFSRVWDVTLP